MARNTNGTGFSLKDELFNEKKVKWLASQFKQADKKFKDREFVSEVMKTLTKLELKQRIVLIAKVLEKYLAKDFEKAAKQIVKALPPELDKTKTDNDFGDFILAPLGDYVVRNGLSKKDLKTSLKTLKEITKRFSMEDTIRYFINKYPEETLKEMGQWVIDEHYHVRRLVSEGTRPLLPWSGRISINQTDTLPFLHKLYADKTRYVTRSVANHLNDIAKIEPALVVKTLKKWQKEGKQEKNELEWMTKHALRTLIKKGDREALELLGYKAKPKIEISYLKRAPAKLAPGETLEFSFKIFAKEDVSLLIDYVIDFVKANGNTKPKVHKLKQIQLKKGDSILISKRHPFRKNATTLTFYSGKHTVTLQINGQQFDAFTFEILM